MNYPGYTLVRREDCPEQHGVLTVLNHDVSGATVLLVENEDTNKAFGIGFGTFPSDDTGVFHILEHSVLAGSEKYPVTSPFLQLLKSSMASFLNAMTFPDKTVYPFATPNETDFRNLMDVYLNAVFCPLAMVDKAVFEQEGWHRDADGTVSGVVYNEMQGALASPDAQLQNALERAMFPDTAYGFVSGGDPASIPALTYEKYQRVYRRHYSADNCCITLYGKMDMAEKLAFLDEHYLSRMPKGTSRPRLTVQDQQNGVRVHIPYYTETPEPDQVQCALAWYTGAFADRERQLGVEILLDALLGTNQSPLKAALLEQKLGADIDIGFDDSTLQPTLELVLRGATAETAPKFAAGVKQAVTDLLAGGIPEELLLASLNAMEFASLERPGSLPDGVLDAIYAATGWLHTGDPALLLHTDKLFASLREKLSTGWFNDLLKDLLLAEPVQVIQTPALPKKDEEDAAPARNDGKLVLDHPLTVADLGDGDSLRLGQQASDAIQVVVGGVCIFLTSAQQRGIGHGVQRQDKVALVVAQRIAQGALGLGPCAVGAVGADGGFQFCQHLLFGVGALDLDGEQRLRFIGNFVAGQAVFLGPVGHCRVDSVHVGQVGVAAPVQGQRLAVGQARVLDFQLRLLQFHHVDAVLGRVVTHQAVIAAVVVAAVGDIGCVGHAVRGKAQLVGVRVIEHRVHLPAGPVDLHADGGAKHRIIVDIIAQQPPDQLVLARAVGLIVVQRVDAVVQLAGRAAAHLIPGGIGDDNIIGKVRARLALILDIGAERIQLARSIHAGQRDLCRLEQRAGVGLVFLKPGQAGVGDKAAAHQRSQYAHNGQHDHKLYHRKTAGALFVFALMQHRCSLHI